jgi:hypothetical protein
MVECGCLKKSEFIGFCEYGQVLRGMTSGKELQRSEMHHPIKIIPVSCNS